jgi:hypothetical protein
MWQKSLYMQLVVALLMNLSSTVAMPPTTARGQHLNCIDRTVQDAEVLARKLLDINQDGNPDDVVIYGHDELYVLVVANKPTLDCEIILGDYLTSRQILYEVRDGRLQ